MNKLTKKTKLLVLYYFRFWAKLQLKKISPNIVAVTGSAGKTSTRKAVSLVLSSLGKVKQSTKANSESGIPLNILSLKPINYTFLDWLRLILLAPLKYLTNWQKYAYYVVEMGIDSPDKPKNMEYLLTILKPQTSIVLNASLVHSQNFDKLVKDKNPERREQKLLEEITKEKGKLVTTLNSHGTAILNADQEQILKLKDQTKAQVITFGKSKKADIQINNISQKKTTFTTTFSYKGEKQQLKLKNTILEDSYAYTFAAALAVGFKFDLALKDSLKKLSNFSPPPGRWIVLKGIRNSSIIDSSYNASPSTLQKALENLKSIAGGKPKIAVIGDMRELGLHEKQAHKNLNSWIIKNTDEVILFGRLTKLYTLPILKNKKFPVKHFEKMHNLTDYLQENLPNDSWILVKGSQNTIFLERAVASILANKNDIKKLPRRGKYWNKKRSLAS